MDLKLKIDSKKSAKCVASSHQCQLWPAVVFLLINLIFSSFALYARHTHTHSHTHTRLDFRGIKRSAFPGQISSFQPCIMLETLGKLLKNNTMPGPGPAPGLLNYMGTGHQYFLKFLTWFKCATLVENFLVRKGVVFSRAFIQGH